MPWQFPPIPPKLKSGDERFLQDGSSVGLSLLDFWRWQGSNLIDNSIRGLVAEFLVVAALGCSKKPRVEWDGYDCLTEEGIKIEIKSSGYIQSWGQKELSLIKFDIGEKQTWNARTNTYSQSPVRSADVYVFCVHNHKDQATINPLDLSQWDFYVVSARKLDAEVPRQQTITLNSLLKRLAPANQNYKDLRTAVPAAKGQS